MRLRVPPPVVGPSSATVDNEGFFFNIWNKRNCDADAFFDADGFFDFDFDADGGDELLTAAEYVLGFGSSGSGLGLILNSG